MHAPGSEKEKRTGSIRALRGQKSNDQSTPRSDVSDSFECDEPALSTAKATATILDNGTVMPAQISSSSCHPLLARIKRNAFLLRR
jgi:hypothetical protein